MIRASKFRVIFSLSLLLVAAIFVIAREHRPSFLRPGLRLYAYVSTSDNAISVVDLVKLATVAHVPVGGAISAMREHPTRAELWGVSSGGGFAWVLDSRTSQITARIPVGACAGWRRDFRHARTSDACRVVGCELRRRFRVGAGFANFANHCAYSRWRASLFDGFFAGWEPGVRAGVRQQLDRRD